MESCVEAGKSIVDIVKGLRQDIKQGATLHQLTAKAIERGYDWNRVGLREFANQIASEYFSGIEVQAQKLIEEPIRSLDEAQGDCDKLFLTRQANIGARQVNICGTIHGHGFLEIIRGDEALSKKYIHLVHECIKDLAEEYSPWLYEQGIGGYFGFKLNRIRYCTQLHDISDYAAYQGRELKDRLRRELKGKGRKESFKFIAKEALEGFGEILTTPPTTYHLSQDLVAVSDAIAEKRTSNPDFILNSLEFVGLARLPEPLDMEIALLLSGNEEKWCSDYVCRSVLQASEIRFRLTKLPERAAVNVLLGAGHVDQVKYLLENPGYDPLTSIAVARKIIQAR